MLSFRYGAQETSLVVLFGGGWKTPSTGTLNGFEEKSLTSTQSCAESLDLPALEAPKLDVPALVELPLESPDLECITSSITWSSSIMDRWRTAKYRA